MGARQRSLPQEQSKTKSRRHSSADSKGFGSCKLTRVRKDNDFLRNENERLRAEITQLQKQVEELSSAWEGENEARHHWWKRYFKRHEEAQKVEGLLALRDARITVLEQELAKKNAHIGKLERILFAPKSEKGLIDTPASPADQEQTAQPARKCVEKRRRGKQPGSPGHGPRSHDALPIDEERVYDIDESCCSDCGEEWQAVSSEHSDEVEVSVRAYRRRHCRKKYGHFCQKKGHWVTKAARGPTRLFPHSSYGISFWVFLLVGKFVLQIPVHRLRLSLAHKNLFVSQGTITAGFARIHKLIAPLVAETKRYSREEKHHWHIDDTGWKVFVISEDKEGFGWYLWVFRSDDVCVYIVSPSRARAVPKSHLENSCGIVTSDRLPSNKKLGEHIRHSFCWVHERREFRNIASGYPHLAKICEHFLQLIASLFHWNAQRLLEADASPAQNLANQKLKETLDELHESCQTHLADDQLHPELRRVLNGILADWDGLSLFFDFPSVPPENNPAERALRGPVVGRKNYYGSGSKWSAQFTADMFTLAATLKLNNVNVEQFLTEYLTACAVNGGKPPSDAAKFLPWHKRQPP